MAERADITVAQLRAILNYNPETGQFRWKEARRGHRAGVIAGSIDGAGYVDIMINKRHYLAHRLAWLWVMGKWPKNQIDHIDMRRDNNRFKNLREATDSQNKANRTAQSNNKLGRKGVQFNSKRGKYEARIRKDGVVTFIGYFDNLENAAKAYATAAESHHGEFARVE
jgi:hypothetical protein